MVSFPVGRTVCDTHDGIDVSRLDKNAVVRSRILVETTLGNRIIETLVSEETRQPYRYTNKHLVVVREIDDGWLLAYSYDGKSLEFITVTI